MTAETRPDAEPGPLTTSGDWRDGTFFVGDRFGYLVKPLSHDSVIEALKIALAWHIETAATGPRPEDTPERLQEWLDSLE